MKTVALLLLLASSAVYADDPDPWAAGVSDDKKVAAEALLRNGNELFLRQDYLGALDKYKQAIAAWDHPAIRFNVVRCLIQLDRPVEASENLDKALQYGPKPLEENVYSEALAYRKLLAAQVGVMDMHCTQPGVKVTIDGEAAATCPGDTKRQVRPGHHQIVGTHEGFLTKTLDITVIGGATERVTLELQTLAQAGTIAHRWPTWVPWVVVASGAGVGLLAGSLQLKAQADMARYKSAVDACSTAGCLISDLDTDVRDRARLENHIALGMTITAAAAVITGGALLYLNRGRLVVPEIAPVRGAGATVSISTTF